MFCITNILFNFVPTNNQSMRKKRYNDVICKAEELVNNPLNRTRSGKLRARVQKKVNRLVLKVTYLTQFEEAIF